MATIRVRFARLVAAAAVAPLLLFGVIAVLSLRSGTRSSVREGSERLVNQAAGQIALYVANNVKVLRALATTLQSEASGAHPHDVLSGYVLDFPEFREITLFDRQGHEVATSRLARPAPAELVVPGLDATGLHISPILIDDDLLPKATITLAVGRVLQPSAYLVGELRLEELWRLIDGIRIGRYGYALIVDRAGHLIAHGDPDEKARIARGELLVGYPGLNRSESAATALEYVNLSGRRTLSASAPIDDLGWTLILEQPTEEAFALSRRLLTLLTVAISLALAVTVVAGVLSARAFIRPIAALMAGTQSVAGGKLDTRVAIEGDQEFQRLGTSFNAMAGRLEELHEETVRQERQATLGRVAAGLAHDLATPVQNISNNCKLILKMHDDAEYRATFQRLVDREVKHVRRVLEDLRNLARPLPLEIYVLDVNRSVREAVESVAAEGAAAGVSLSTDLTTSPAFIAADLFAMGRVYRNLLVNAIQATPPGGRVEASTRLQDGRVLIAIEDTGSGIRPDRLGSIFDEFVTTKRRGLGLGLAISRRIVEQLGGVIRVTSQLGRGTKFVLEFPAAPARDGAMGGSGTPEDERAQRVLP